jgi:hypothetical protein
MKPGVDVISRSLPPPRIPPTDTGVGFVVGATAAGVTPTPPQYALMHSMTEYVAVFGARTGVGIATYDSAEVFFREGGSQLYVSRTNPGVMAAEAEAGDEPPPKKGSRAGGDTVEPTVVDPTVQAALDALVKALGPGQVWIADATLAANAANQAALLAHAAAKNRVALCSCADGTATAIAAAGTALQSDTNARYGALFAPSAIVPGVTPGTTRTVPYPAVQAGMLARNDNVYTPNQPAAGVLGMSVYCLDVAAHFTDAEYNTMNEASVTCGRLLYGGVRTYGNRSCVAAATAPDWSMFGWPRLNMAIIARADAVGEAFIFKCLDGRGHMLGDFAGALSAMLAGYWEADALYGDSPQEAFDVNVGPSVNTPTTIANGELHAVLSVRMSPSPEWVVIEIVKVAPNVPLPALAA